MFDLHPYQQDDVESYLAEPSYAGLNATGVGGGKTLVAVEISRRMDARNIVVVAPANTERGWRRHFEIQRDMPTYRIGGSTKAQQQATLDMIAGKPGAFFGSWEYFRGKGWADLRPDLVIADEVHRAANRKSQQAAAYHSLADGVFSTTEGRMLALSGTPAGNHMSGIWSVGRGLWPEMYKGGNQTPRGQQPGLAYWKWCEHYFNMEVNPWSGYKDPTTEIQPGKLMSELPYYVRHVQGEACCNHHPKGLQADLPPVVEHVVTVKLTAAQRKMYKAMEADMLVWMDDHEWPIDSGALPLVQHLRLLQICLGTPETILLPPKGDSDEMELKVSFPLDTVSSKIDAVLDILRDIPDGEPVVAWTHSTALIPALVHRINAEFASKGHHVATRWDGTVSGVNRDRILDGFGTGGANIIVAQIAALAEGVDGLQHVCANEIIVSKSANNLQNSQAFGGVNGGGRIDRPGQKRTVNRWIIEAENTLEEPKEERLQMKESRLAVGLRK